MGKKLKKLERSSQFETDLVRRVSENGDTEQILSKKEVRRKTVAGVAVFVERLIMAGRVSWEAWMEITKDGETIAHRIGKRRSTMGEALRACGLELS